jgi:hypothetical protein
MQIINRKAAIACSTAVLAAALGLGGCATQPAGDTDMDSAGIGETAPPPVIEPYEGYGMEIPLDGRSLEHFNTYMARVQKYSSEKDYTTLEDAIEYLLFYDLSVNRDKEKLIAKLDGMTGYQVLEKVNWRKPAPGRSQAEKGAADAKIIDT